MDLEALKRDAALAALSEVKSGMRLGLGTGSTVAHFLSALAEAQRRGALQDIAGVPTSERTARQCRAEGIALLSLEEAGPLDLAVDGADEIDPNLDLIKGLGGALLREKMVAAQANRFLVIADHTKDVSRLGTRSPLPIEVVPFAWRSHLPFLAKLGGRAVPRCGQTGDLVLTDNGNVILDLHFEAGIADAAKLAHALDSRPGIVDHGLFLGMCARAILATPTGVVSRSRSS
jgi:ribose 5-phosphate isomerase A